MRKQWNSVQRFSLRKFSTGLASVLLATMFMSQGVMAQTNEVSEKINDTEVVKPNEKNTLTTVQPKVTEGVETEKVEVPEQPVIAAEKPQPTTILEKEKEKIEGSKVAINTTKLETLIKEVEGLDIEKYTEESVKELNVRLAKAKDALVNAKSQKEIDSAYNALVGYKNSGLKRVPKLEENNTPKLDTTGGKETVGKKAENTEANGTNIAGRNHILNGTTLPEGSRFRTGDKPELTDVQIGRWNGTRRTFDSSNVFVTPANYGVVGNVMKIKAISASDNFTNIEVTGNQGFPLKVKKNIKGKEAELYFEGNTPSNGSWNMTVTATTAKGTKTFNFGYYTALRKPAILTQNTALEGKAKEKPTIEVEVPTFSPAPTGAKFKVYLVRGGSTNGWDNNGNAYPSGYSVLASADVVASTGGKGIATINANNYRVSEVGTTPFKAISVIEINGRENDTDPGERGSWFSEERKATEKLANKNELQAEINRETATKAAAQYKNADQGKKAAYDQALTRAKAVMADGAASQEEVNTAKSALEGARTALDGQATNKNELQAEINRETATKAAAQYKNADQGKKAAYDNALTAGKEVNEKADATQEEVTNALNAINTAKRELDGQATDKAALNTALSEETATKASAAYYNATLDKKTAYDNAVESGKAIFNRADATQTEVNDAVTAIANAKNALDGKETNHSQSDNDMMKALLAKKSEAKMLIEQEAMKKKAEISQAELSESEKALLDARVDQEKAKAFQMIDQATTIEEVNQALKAGIEAIRSIAVVSANGRMTDVTPEESEEAMAQAHRQALPQTGTGNEVAIFGAAASAILAGLGLVVPSKKKED